MLVSSMLPPGRLPAQRCLCDCLYESRVRILTLKWLLTEGFGRPLPPEEQALLTKWGPTLDAWLREHSELRERLRSSDHAEQNWESLIIQVGKILQGAVHLRDDASALMSTSNDDARDILEKIRRCAGHLYELYEVVHKIERKPYRYWWTSSYYM